MRRALEIAREVLAAARAQSAGGIGATLDGAAHELRAQFNVSNEEKARVQKLERDYIARGEQLDKERRDYQSRLAIEVELRDAHKQRADAMAAGWDLTAAERDAWKLRFAQLVDCGLGPKKGCGAKCLACATSQWTGWMERAKKAEGKVDGIQSTLDMYAHAWIRELGGRIRAKSHEIDGLVLTTREITARAQRFEATYKLVKEALAQLLAIPSDSEKAVATLKKAAE